MLQLKEIIYIDLKIDLQNITMFNNAQIKLYNLIAFSTSAQNKGGGDI